jgi:hypothetical protein
MASEAEYQVVPLDRIDIGDLRYKITTGGASEPLVASIKRAGILTPPVLIPKKGDILTIVSGFRRIEALLRLGAKETVARVLEGKTEHERCIEIAIVDNSAQRKMNPVEQGRVVQLLASLYAHTETLCQVACDLGVPLNPTIARKLRVVAQMKSYLQMALVDGYVALPVALQLAGMEDQSSAERIALLMSAMGLGLNRQRELLEWLKAISIREEIPLRTLLDDKKIKRVMENPDLDRKQKSHQLRHYFRQKRYPEMVKREAQFQKMVKSLHLGNGIQLKPPAYFEGLSYTLKIEFKDRSELVSRYQRLEKMMDSPEIASLWDLLRML